MIDVNNALGDGYLPLLRRLLGPSDPELTCEECFEFLDEYVELESAAIPAERVMPRMRAHLQGCAACREEHDSLLAIVQTDG